MLYFNIDADGNVLAATEKYAEIPGAGTDPTIWARQPIGGVWNANYTNGTLVAGWLSRSDVPSYEYAVKLATSAAANLKKNFIAVDNGPAVHPQFDVIEAPAVGDDVSKGFNGDYYPIGKIVKISGANQRIVTVDGPYGLLKFYRRRLTGSWVQSGGTWGLVAGIVDRLSPEF